LTLKKLLKRNDAEKTRLNNSRVQLLGKGRRTRNKGNNELRKKTGNGVSQHFNQKKKLPSYLLFETTRKKNYRPKLQTEGKKIVEGGEGIKRESWSRGRGK